MAVVLKGVPKYSHSSSQIANSFSPAQIYLCLIMTILMYLTDVIGEELVSCMRALSTPYSSA